MKLNKIFKLNVFEYIYFAIIVIFLIFYSFCIYDFLEAKSSERANELKFLSNYYNIIFSSTILMSFFLDPKAFVRAVYIILYALTNKIIWSFF